MKAQKFITARTAARPASRSIADALAVAASIAVVLLLPVILALDVGAAGARTIRILAASSLTEAFQDIAALYRAQNPGTEIEFSFAGSQVLRVQIDEGANADVFASADHAQMDALKAKGTVGADALFARNRLVVVTPRSNPRVTRLGDLARPGIRVVIADANVPVGRYTLQALAKMNRAALYGDDYQKRVTTNVVSQETNVRGVLAKVALGEVDAGIVYATDARTAADKVVVLEIPDRLNVVAEYPIAVLAGSGAKEEASRFVDLLLSSEGQSALAARGFQPVKLPASAKVPR